MEIIITLDDDTAARLRACGKRYGVENPANLAHSLVRAALSRDEIIHAKHGGTDARLREALTGRVSVRERVDAAFKSLWPRRS